MSLYKAAKRLGFKYEGLFKNHTIYKQEVEIHTGSAMLDDEWSVYKTKFENWLNEYNFDESGNQINKLSL